MSGVNHLNDKTQASVPYKAEFVTNNVNLSKESDRSGTTLAKENSSEDSKLKGVKNVENNDQSLSVNLNQQRGAGSLESEKPELSVSEVQEGLKKLNNFLPLKSTNLIFEFDELGDPPIVKVVDKESSEVIREIPSNELKEVTQALEDFVDKLDSKSGFLFNKVV